MDRQNINESITTYGLNCTIEEFQTYYDAVDTSALVLPAFVYEAKGFSEPFEGKPLVNKTGNPYAVWVFIPEFRILQLHKPCCPGFEPIMPDDAEGVAQEQFTQIVEGKIAEYKLQQTIEHFKA